MASHGSSKKMLFPPSVQIAKLIMPLKKNREFIIALQKANMIDLIPVDTAYSMEAVNIRESKEKTNILLTKLSTILDAIYLSSDVTSRLQEQVEVDSSFDSIVTLIEETVNDDFTQISDLVNIIEESESEISQFNDLNDFYLNLKRFDVDPSLLFKGERTFTIFGYINENSFERLNWELREITNNSVVIIKQESENDQYPILLTALNKYEESVMNSLRQYNAEIISISEEYSDFDFAHITEIIEAKEAKLLEYKEEMSTYRKEKSDLLLAYYELLTIENERFDLFSKMKRTKSTLICWGWVKETDVDRFKDYMTNTLGDAVDIEITTPDFSEEHYPSAVSNTQSGFFKPYRDLVSAFGVPGYNEIDPMGIMVFLFPFLFGLMFADVGHGLIMALVGLFALYYRKTKGEVTNEFGAYIVNGAELLIMCGISAFFFGFIFGSFFGDETFLRSISWLSFLDVFWDHMFDSSGKRNVMTVLIISFAVGVLIISFGLCLNIYQKIIYRHSIIDPLAPFFLLVFYWGVIIALAVNPTIGFALLAIGLVGLFTVEIMHGGGEGAMMAFDHILSLISNTLSFGRILALNMVHAILSGLPYIMYDRFAGTHLVSHDPATWSLNLWPFIFCATIGALIVIPIEGLISFLHTLRLNWVEWFSKFYEGRGYVFDPVKVKRYHTVEKIISTSAVT